jgi:hypothetical protein
MTSQTFKIAIYQYSNSNLSHFLRLKSARFFQAQKDTQQAERVIWEYVYPPSYQYRITYRMVSAGSTTGIY